MIQDTTEWRWSAKGNLWRKENGQVLEVGGDFGKGFWATRDGWSLDMIFDSLEQAQEYLDSQVVKKMGGNDDFNC